MGISSLSLERYSFNVNKSVGKFDKQVVQIGCSDFKLSFDFVDLSRVYFGGKWVKVLMIFCNWFRR